MVIFSFSYTWQVCFPFLLWESVEKLAWPDQRLGRRGGGGGVIPDTLKGPCWMPKWQSFFALVYTSSRVIPPPCLSENLFGRSPTLKPVTGSPPFFTWQLMWSVLRILTRTASPLTSLMAICVISWVKLKSVREHSVITVATWLPI